MASSFIRNGQFAHFSQIVLINLMRVSNERKKIKGGKFENRIKILFSFKLI